MTLMANGWRSRSRRLWMLLLVISMLLSPLSVQARGANIITTEPVQQASGSVAITGTDGALLRDAPDGNITQVLPVGLVLTVVGRTEESQWLAVDLADGQAGWIAAAELVVFGVERLLVVESGAVDSRAVDSRAVDSEVVASGDVTAIDKTSSTAVSSNAIKTVVTGQVTLTNSRLNVRSGPATSYAIVGKVQPAQQLTLLGRNAAGDWVQVQLGSAEQAESSMGWVASRYLETTTDLMALPVDESVSRAPAYQPVSQSSVALSPADLAPVDLAPADLATVGANGQGQMASASGLSGTLVIQTGPGGMIYAYRLATGQLWPLTNGFDPAISPDGTTVAFVREGGQNGLYLVDIDGSNERLIFSGRERLSSPKWSPDGQWILFTRSDEYAECVDLGRGGCVSIGSLPPGLPTDTLILSKDYEYNLAAVDPNGNGYHDIAALESARVADWNSAGIVYQSSAGLQITADQVDATNRLLLFIPLQPPHEDPDWQPNGGKIAFVQRHGSHSEIFTINADGSGMAPLTQPVTTLVAEMPNNVAPAWSPDGQHIVFLSNRDAGNEAGAWRVWIMDADGSNQHPLSIDLSINYTYGNEQAVDWGN